MGEIVQIVVLNLNFQSVDEILKCSPQIKVIEQYFSVLVLFIMLRKVLLIFERSAKV